MSRNRVGDLGNKEWMKNHLLSANNVPRTVLIIWETGPCLNYLDCSHHWHLHSFAESPLEDLNNHDCLSLGVTPAKPTLGHCYGSSCLYSCLLTQALTNTTCLSFFHSNWRTGEGNTKFLLMPSFTVGRNWPSGLTPVYIAAVPGFNSTEQDVPALGTYGVLFPCPHFFGSFCLLTPSFRL